jgi:hypothetical protein
MKKPKSKQRTYDDHPDKLDNRPMTWVDSSEMSWDAHCARYLAERGYEPFPLWSAYAPGNQPGWFFPADWVR